MAGWTLSFDVGSNEFYIVKTNGNGDILWTRIYGWTSFDYARSACETSDGGYIVVGEAYSSERSYDFGLVKTDSLGDMLWTRTYGGGDHDGVFSIQQTSDEGYVMVGFTRSFGAGHWDSYLVKIDSLGDTLWTRTYGGSEYDAAYSGQQTTDGGYILAGFTESFGEGEEDFYIVKTGPDISLAEPLENLFPADYVLHPNFPNPFNLSTQIVYSLPKSSKVSLKVFNLLGQEVASLVNETQSAGTHHVSFDGSSLPSGIYLCRFQAGGFSTTRKMVLLK